MNTIKNNKIKVFTITLITAIIMGISSITIYSNISGPKFYDYFIDTGIKYLMDGKYEEAILSFNKAIEIEEKSTEARVYLAEGYVGNHEYDKAIEVLEEAQDLDITNEELLIDILEILNEINPEIIEEFLNRFINFIGKDNLSEEIKEILATVNESPNIPILDPKPGTYIDDISISLKLDKIKVGHTYYYTTNGSEPTKESNKYIGRIDISSSTIIKIIGYNKNDESTEVMTLEYIIDKEIIKNIHNTLSESEELAKNTKVGIDIGNTTEEAKKNFNDSILKVKKSLNKKSISYDEAKNIKIQIEKALDTFKDNIIEPTDKSQLKKVIEEAKKLHNETTEGNEEGKYVPGSKGKLLNVIKESQKVYDDILSNQKEIDNQVSLMKKQIEEFKSKIHSNIESKILGKFIIDEEYGDVYKFTKDKIFGSWLLSLVSYDKIYSKRIEGNKIYYNLGGSVAEVELINDNTVRFLYINAHRSDYKIFKLSNSYDLIKYWYDTSWDRDVVNLRLNSYGITQQQINNFNADKANNISKYKAVELVENRFSSLHNHNQNTTEVRYMEGNNYVVYASHKYCECGMWGDDYGEWYYVDMYTGKVSSKY